MKKLSMALLGFVFLSTVINAQTKTGLASGAPVLSAEQKNFLATTWFESPKESENNKIVFRLTEYVMIAGLDMYAIPPGKINLSDPSKFNSEYFKSCNNNNEMMAEGKWNVKGKAISLNFGKQNCSYTILEIEKDKLVLSIN